ncbi:hypothetical protein [Actinoplanes rectilineatus]|uniref:hypothetical protein n=1 Tax=Actinoplanes rectilineatus TaxID=113571 RepID=UPI000ADE9DD3|nr:hypothetical protein [Actinoplanes rectilineatus]
MSGRRRAPAAVLWKRRLRYAGSRMLTTMGDWTAPGPPGETARPTWSEANVSHLVGAVTIVTGLLFLAIMVVTWLAKA